MAEEQKTEPSEESVAASPVSNVPDKVSAAHTVGSAISGASAGAVVGALLGPIGAVTGSIIGGLIGGFLQAPPRKEAALQHPSEPDKQAEPGKGGDE